MAGFNEYDELLKKLQNPQDMANSSWDSSIEKLSQGQDLGGAAKGMSKFPKTESQLGTSPTSEGQPAPGEQPEAPDIDGFSTDAQDAAAGIKPAEFFKGSEPKSSGGIMDLIKKFGSMGG